MYKCYYARQLELKSVEESEIIQSNQLNTL
jgi:hypothetical protein